MTGPGGREEEMRNFRTSNMRPRLLGPDGEPIPVRIESADPGAFPGFNPKDRDKTGGPGADSFRAVLDDQRAIAATAREVANELRTAAEMARQFQVTTQATQAAHRQEFQESAREQRQRLNHVLDEMEHAFGARQSDVKSRAPQAPDAVRAQDAPRSETSQPEPDRYQRDPIAPRDLPDTQQATSQRREQLRRDVEQDHAESSVRHRDRAQSEPDALPDLDSPKFNPPSTSSRPADAPTTAGPKPPRNPPTPTPTAPTPTPTPAPAPAPAPDGRMDPGVVPPLGAARGVTPSGLPPLGGSPPASPVSGGGLSAMGVPPLGAANGGGGLPPLGPPPASGASGAPDDDDGDGGGGGWTRSAITMAAGQYLRTKAPGLGRAVLANARPIAMRYARGGTPALANAALRGARVVPGLGTAVIAGEVINRGLEEVTEQRQQNAQYQSIYAGSNWEGLGQRVQEQGFVWGNRLNALRGGLTEEDSRTAFQGVSQLGMRDSERGNALKMVEQNYADLGMDVQRSLQLMQISAKGANSQFAGLTSALKNVSTMARSTGQNANVLYDSFAKNYQMTLSMGMGPQGAALAAGLTGASAGISRDLQNTDSSGTSSYFYQRRLSQITGVPYTAMQARAARGEPQIMEKAIDKDRYNVARNAFSAQGRGVIGLLDEAAKKAGGGKNVVDNDGQLTEIARDVMERGGDVEQLKSFIESYGGVTFPNMSPEQITKQAAAMYLDPERVQHEAEGSRVAMDQKDLDTVKESGAKSGYGPLGLTTINGASEFVRKNYSINPFSTEGGVKNDVLHAYSERQDATHKSDPVIESVIDKVGNRSEIGIEVETGNGKKVVDQATAIKYYGDQIAKGSAKFAGGDADYDGKSVKDVTGYGERNLTGPDSSKDATDHGGTDAAQWKKDHPTEESEAKEERGKVTISLQPGLEKIFNLQTEGAATVDAGAAAAVPPASRPPVPR